MKVTLRFLGILEEYAKTSSLELELPPGATLKNLLEEVGRSFGARFPGELWDQDKLAFFELVSVFVDGQEVEGGNPPLRDGAEVILLTMISGGSLLPLA